MILTVCVSSSLGTGVPSPSLAPWITHVREASRPSVHRSPACPAYLRHLPLDALLAPQFILSKWNSLCPPSLIQASPPCLPWSQRHISTCLLPVSLETISHPVLWILASESLLEMFPRTGLTPSHLLASLTFHPASDRSGHVTPLISIVDTGREIPSSQPGGQLLLWIRPCGPCQLHPSLVRL